VKTGFAKRESKAGGGRALEGRKESWTETRKNHRYRGLKVATQSRGKMACRIRHGELREECRGIRGKTSSQKDLG